MAFLAQGKAAFLCLEGRWEGGKVGFTGQRKSLVDSKQAWKEPRASQNGFLQCLTEVQLPLHWALEEPRKDFKKGHVVTSCTPGKLLVYFYTLPNSFSLCIFRATLYQALC